MLRLRPYKKDDAEMIMSWHLLLLMIMKEKLMMFVKQETVLVIAILLAVFSGFFVAPSKEYLSYIDWRVLGILLSLMIIMSGLQKTGLFDSIGSRLLKKTRNTRQLSLMLVFLCFFFSMLITNDVALFIFVPFAMIILKKCNQEDLLIPVLVLQTIAANMGSMLTPIGNPQNLYLYNLSGMGMDEFLLVMLPYTLASFVFLAVSVLLCCRNEAITEVVVEKDEKNVDGQTQNVRNELKNAVYITLFLLSLLVVARIISFGIVLVLVLIMVFYMDRKVLIQVDYCLLLTFIAFFIFTGNMGNIPVIRDTLQRLVAGRELGIGILASQAISNVPAALLLSGFTSNYKSLLIGVNVGGLGTLIASMASLISCKLFAKEYNCEKGRYFRYFTVVNIIFLAILVLLAMVLCKY